MDPFTAAFRDQIVAVLRVREIAMTAAEISVDLPRLVRFVRTPWGSTSSLCADDHARIRSLAPRVFLVGCEPGGHLLSELPGPGFVSHQLSRLMVEQRVARHAAAELGQPAQWTWVDPAQVAGRAEEARVAEAFEALVAASWEWP